MVGINQIRNTYMQHLLQDANEDVFFLELGLFPITNIKLTVNL
jgi:hypothetical protein